MSKIKILQIFNITHIMYILCSTNCMLNIITKQKINEIAAQMQNAVKLTYLVLSVEIIVCGDDFNVCVIFKNNKQKYANLFF